MADQSFRGTLESIALALREPTTNPEVRSTAMVCLTSFAACATATLIVCILTPSPPGAQLWRQAGDHSLWQGRIGGNSAPSDYPFAELKLTKRFFGQGKLHHPRH